MVAIPLVIGILTFIAGCQWAIQDSRLESELEQLVMGPSGIIQEVDSSDCTASRPVADGAICAESVEWWVPTDASGCNGGQCYQPAWVVEYNALMEEWERSFLPLLIPGLLPLIFLFVVIRKVRRARAALSNAPETTENQSASHGL